MLTIHQMAERTGVTIRALRYYDKIGLLPPGAVSPAGYRLYGPAELERLQQILFFRELEFPLAEIKAILASPAYDRTAALTAQRALLRAKRDRLDGLLRLVEAALKGETTMEMASFPAVMASSLAGTSLNCPWNLPMAVRQALTMTTSLGCI